MAIKTILSQRAEVAGNQGGAQCPVCGNPLERRPGSAQWWCSSCGWTQPRRGEQFIPPEEWGK